MFAWLGFQSRKPNHDLNLTKTLRLHPPLNMIRTLNRQERKSSFRSAGAPAAKTFLARWVIDRAQMKGREIVVADADRTNPTLAANLKGVLTPPSADDREMQEWFKALCEQQIAQRFNLLIDLGGGDLLLKQLARRIGLVPFLEANGIDMVAVHLIGPERDDLAYLRDLETDGLVAPEATILALNESLVPQNLVN